jgi:hypothetical protein
VDANALGPHYCAQFTVPFVQFAAWWPSMPQMLHAWIDDPAGLRSLWCFSIVRGAASSSDRASDYDDARDY